MHHLGEFSSRIWLIFLVALSIWSCTSQITTCEQRNGLDGESSGFGICPISFLSIIKFVDFRGVPCAGNTLENYLDLYMLD